MDNRYYDGVITEMKPFLGEQGFVSRADGSFLNATRSVRVEYSEERQMYLLLMAEVTENGTGDYTELSSWLFDDTQNARDAAAVGVDFTATLRESLGIRLKRVSPAGEIDLPSGAKDGAMTVSGFTKKMLDVFPQHKDDYKEHVATYGSFLYLKFFGEYLVPEIKAVLSENSKKQVKKLFELLETGYLQGDRETVNIIVAVTAAAAYGDEELTKAAFCMLEEDKHFSSSLKAFIPALARNKKLISVLVGSQS